MSGIPSLRLAQMAGITYRQLNFWVGSKYVRPTSPPDGPGVHWEFDNFEARVVVLMGRLVAVGVKPQSAAPMARELASNGVIKRGDFVIVAAQAGIEAA